MGKASPPNVQERQAVILPWWVWGCAWRAKFNSDCRPCICFAFAHVAPKACGVKWHERRKQGQPEECPRQRGGDSEARNFYAEASSPLDSAGPEPGCEIPKVQRQPKSPVVDRAAGQYSVDTSNRWMRQNAGFSLQAKGSTKPGLSPTQIFSGGQMIRPC